MSTDKTVGITVGEVKGLFVDLNEKLSSDKGREWVEAFKLFLKKQNPWEQAANMVVEQPTVPVDRVRVIDALTIEVNLDAPPILPFDDAKIANTPKGKGWVRVERRGEDLYVDGKRVDLWLSKRQKDGNTVRGHDLRTEVEARSPYHPNIMDALYEHQHLVPDKFKKDKDGKTVYTFFWDVIFAHDHDGLCVRCFYWGEGVCYQDCGWLDRFWHFNSPAAVPAS